MRLYPFKTGLSALLLMFTGTITACTKDTEEVGTLSEADVEMLSFEASRAADLLGQRLKGRLMEAMKAEGPVAAIKVCAEEAPGIAADVSAETGFEVRRTALKVRNPDNSPDAWEREILEDFISESLSTHESNSDDIPMVRFEADGQTFRWARAIKLEPPCATCHGTQIGPEIRTAISERYPSDLATGFEIGEVRGMFTVTRK